MAAQAASFSTWWVAKSGNPCDRLTASNSCASRVISRITDSVNSAAFFDPLGFMCLLRVSASWRRDSGILLGAVEAAIVFGSTQNPLHVALGLGIRDSVDELLTRKARAVFSQPPAHSPFAGIVTGQREVHRSELANLVGKVLGAHADIRLGGRQQPLRVRQL